MSDKPTILLFQPKSVPSAPEALVFLQGLSRVVTLSQNADQNHELLKHEVRGAEFNDDPNPIVVIQLVDFSSRTNRVEFAPRLNELVTNARKCGLSCYILNRTDDRITWSFRQVKKCVSTISSLLGSSHNTYELGPPKRLSELFDSQSYTGNHVDWTDPRNWTTKNLNPPSAPAPNTSKTLSPGVAYHYLFG